MLLEDDLFELLDVVQPLRPLAGLQADDAADHLDDALQQQQHAGRRNQRLVLVDRQAVRAVGRVLVGHPGLRGEAVAGIDEGDDAGEEEQEIEHQVHQRLRRRGGQAR